jgi:hypothetical protein
MPVLVKTILLLTASNVFMTFAWYAHLRDLNHKPWFIAAVVSWGIAFFEYMLQVPANRIGYQQLSLPQLKLIQEVITLTVFVPFALLYMKQALSWNHLWSALCLVGAVYFAFRGVTGVPAPAHASPAVAATGVDGPEAADAGGGDGRLSEGAPPRTLSAEPGRSVAGPDHRSTPPSRD